MSTPRLEPVESKGQLMLTGLREGPITLSLHSSARMKLLGNRIAEFDPLAPEVASRIVRAAQQIIEADDSHSSDLVITALDLD